MTLVASGPPLTVPKGRTMPNENSIVVEINKPVEIVFQFTTDPENTPKWIPSVKKEWVTEQPVAVGSKYRQILSDGQEAVYYVQELVENKRFTLGKEDSNYACTYLYETLPNGTRLTYTETTSQDEVLEPLEQVAFLQLKALIENL